MASKAIHPIIQRLIDLIEPTEDGRQAGPTSAFGHARNKGTNPHGGFDINRGKDVPGSVASPVYGKIGTVVRGGLGTIVIHESIRLPSNQPATTSKYCTRKHRM